ncbi:hypothetical protein IscW_ISCW007320 [Ixodes scapularis]|uniref:Uncharacterized protein n=1 Tax=Ixodes scapularis TaxID=6945 RepID=B7PUS6_IXOSC|nr:hypothetical protein IscW_ISCW007320 [Ixodes scapularis]|eukprot:XP_002406699.1 hypothetical protein IscW_ISCW007320 [Ixodes scapularis]
MAWAPGKGVKSKELKDFWEVDLGVSYIPYEKLPKDVDLVSLEEGGVIDEDSLPEDLREKRRAQEQQRTQGGPGLAPSTVAGGGGADVVAAMAAFPGAAMTTPVVTTMAAPGGAATAVAMVPPPVAQFGIPLPPGNVRATAEAVRLDGTLRRIQARCGKDSDAIGSSLGGTTEDLGPGNRAFES